MDPGSDLRRRCVPRSRFERRDRSSRGRGLRRPRGHVVPGAAVRLKFANLHFDGEIQTKWDILFRIVGDFSILIRDRTIYREVEFCLVEFAVALANWFAIATDLGPDFEYTSLESETEGLVRFTWRNPGTWRVSAAHQDENVQDVLTTVELKDAAIEYIRDVRAGLKHKVDILQYIEDASVREVVRQKLE